MSHETSYLQHLRRKDAAVHSISEIQKDLTSHIRDIQEVKATLEAVPCLPHSGALKTDALVQTLENKAILTLFSNQDALLAGIQSKLERTIKILLAHTEELKTPDLNLFPPREFEHNLNTFVATSAVRAAAILALKTQHITLKQQNVHGCQITHVPTLFS